MADEVGIVNSALNKIGAATITSLTEGSRTANVANEQFAKLRDDLLRSAHWNFATRVVQLAKSTTTPAAIYDNQFVVPATFLRVIEVYDNDAGIAGVSYSIEHDESEGVVIRSNADQLWLKYVSRIEDPNRWSADFREALAWKMAAEWAIPIAQSGTLHERMFAQFQRALRKARSADGIENFPDRFAESPWVSTRGGAGNPWWWWT